MLMSLLLFFVVVVFVVLVALAVSYDLSAVVGALAFALEKVVLICCGCCGCCCCIGVSGKSRTSTGSCWYRNSRCMRSSGRWHWACCCRKLCLVQSDV